MLCTDGDPRTLTLLEERDAFECIEQINAIINSDDTPWENIDYDDITYIITWLRVWGVVDKLSTINYYTVTEIDLKGNGDEFDSYEGFDFDEFLRAARDVRQNNSYALECRVFRLPKFIANEDKDMIVNAICECAGYDILDGCENENSNIFKLLRDATKMSQSEFAEYLEIPLGSLKNWEQELRSCPDYLIKLIKFKLKADGKI